MDPIVLQLTPLQKYNQYINCMSSVESLLVGLVDKASNKFIKEAESLLSDKLKSFKSEASKLLGNSGSDVDVDSVVKDFVSKLNSQLVVSLDALVARFESEAQEFINQSSSGNNSELKAKLEETSENVVFDSITSLESKLQRISDTKLTSLSESSDNQQDSDNSENSDSVPDNSDHSEENTSTPPSPSSRKAKPKESKRIIRTGRLPKLGKR